MNLARASIVACLALAAPQQAPPEYSMRAIRYATIPQFQLSGLIPGAPADQRIDIAMVIWVIQGAGRTILFDSGFHRARWIEQFRVSDFMRPDSAVMLAGVSPDSVTDIIVSHAHWDHMGGIDLFPRATVWIQKEEYRYYTGEAWQQDGRRGGIDTLDLQALLRKNTGGKLRLIDGDDIEILPGIRVYTGARHTFASQYVRVAGARPFVLASDNAYLYRNFTQRIAGATFLPTDRPANLAALTRMIQLAGDTSRIVPGHDPEQFVRFTTRGRVAVIR
ncbi:MAG: N-acyl homoserine lactonase family protein [Longimicrobiales bacterium]